MRFSAIPTTAAALSLVSAVAFSQTAFERHDNNNDGKLTKDEFYGVARDAGTFADFDANRDARLDEDEWDTIGINGDFDTWDLNGDSYLDDNEFYTGTYDWFDEDNNSYLDDNEWDDVDQAGWLDV